MTIGGEAHLDLHVDTGLAAYTESFPSLETDLTLDWNLSDPNSLAVDLHNISLDLGNVLGSALQPLVDFVQPILEPIQPVIAVLNEPIPVLSDLSHFVGGPDVALIDLLGLGSAALPEAYEELVDLGILVADIAELVGDFSTEQGLVLNFGDSSINDLTTGGLLGLSPAYSPTDFQQDELQPGFTRLAGGNTQPGDPEDDGR